MMAFILVIITLLNVVVYGIMLVVYVWKKACFIIVIYILNVVIYVCKGFVDVVYIAHLFQVWSSTAASLFSSAPQSVYRLAWVNESC